MYTTVTPVPLTTSDPEPETTPVTSIPSGLLVLAAIFGLSVSVLLPRLTAPARTSFPPVPLAVAAVWIIASPVRVTEPKMVAVWFAVPNEPRKAPMPAPDPLSVKLFVIVELLRILTAPLPLTAMSPVPKALLKKSSAVRPFCTMPPVMVVPPE